MSWESARVEAFYEAAERIAESAEKNNMREGAGDLIAETEHLRNAE